jgi:hypothetical protein
MISMIQLSSRGSKSFLFPNRPVPFTETLAPRQTRQTVDGTGLFGEDEMPAKGYFKNRVALCHPDRKHFAFDLCENCYKKKYRTENKEKVRASIKSWHDANRDRDRATQKEWKKRNPERVKKLNKEYTERNYDQVTASQRAYQENNSEELLKKHRVYNLDKREEIHAKHIKKKYKLSIVEYNDILEYQGGVCDICGGTNGDKHLFVDHNHTSGKVRGLLCKKCNSAIGLFRDDIGILNEAIAYLKKHDGE